MKNTTKLLVLALTIAALAGCQDEIDDPDPDTSTNRGEPDEGDSSKAGQESDSSDLSSESDETDTFAGGDDTGHGDTASGAPSTETSSPETDTPGDSDTGTVTETEDDTATDTETGVDTTETDDTATTGAVEGSVELQGESAHNGVTVTLDDIDGYAATSDADGHYRLEDVPPGSHTVSATLWGYVGRTSAPFTVAAGSTTVVAPLLLPRARGSIHGYARLDDTADHSGISISLRGTAFATVTDSSGHWTIEDVPVGQYTVDATYDGYLSAFAPDQTVAADGLSRASDIALHPDRSPSSIIKIEATDAQNGVAGEPLPEPLQVKVVNGDGLPVYGATVTFTATEGQGFFEDDAQIETATDAQGLASATFMLGTASPTNRVSAAVEGLEPVFFEATGLIPAKIADVSEEDHFGVVDETLPHDVVIEVRDAADAPIPGVSLSLSAAPGEISPAAGTTDDAGRIDAEWKLGTVAGAQTLSVSWTPSRGGVFELGAITGHGDPDAASCALRAATPSGDGQSQSIGLATVTPLRALAADRFGNPLPGIVVRWSFEDGDVGLVEGGLGVHTSAPTGEDGLSEARVTPGEVKTMSLSATPVDACTGTVGFEVTGTAFVDEIAISPADPAGTVGEEIGPFEVTVRGETTPLPGVKLVVTGEGDGNQRLDGEPGPLVLVTDSQGTASFSYTLGTTWPHGGGYGVAAAVPGDESASLAIDATHGDPATIEIAAGDGQSALPCATLPSPLVVEVRDGYENPCGTSTVSWTSPGSSPSVPAAGFAVSSETAESSLSQVEMSCVYPEIAGGNRFTASVDGATPPLEVTFEMTALEPAAPVVSALSPESAPVGSDAVELGIFGTGFSRESRVEIDGEERPTTYVSASELRATATAGDLTDCDGPDIAVVNYTGANGRSSAHAVSMSNIFGLEHTLIAPGFAGDVEISGRFDAQATVLWNESTELQATFDPSQSTWTMTLPPTQGLERGTEHSVHVRDESDVLCEPAWIAVGHPLPGTGQTSLQCADVDHNLSSCDETPASLFGQDGHRTFEPRQRSFTPNEEAGTVYDRLTGLTWQAESTEGLLWQQAVNHCEDLTTSDLEWRLASLRELVSIMDWGRQNPSLPPELGGGSYEHWTHWSSTPHLEDASEENTWCAVFEESSTFQISKELSIPLYTRCVSGPAWPRSDLAVDSNGSTVTDSATHLMWSRAPSGAGIWQSALQSCEELVLAGHDDWRLPDIAELHSIVEYTKAFPALDTGVFSASISDPFWSSTNRILDASQVWTVGFQATGAVSARDKDSSLQFRCVRSLN